jgi:uncharacterized protein
MSTTNMDLQSLDPDEQELIQFFRTARKRAAEATSTPAHAFIGHEASTRLFDMDVLDIPVQHRDWFARLVVEAQKVMSLNDNSHNWEHIQRVVAIAHRIFTADRPAGVEPATLYAAAIVHDVGDGKYLKNGETSEQKTRDLFNTAKTPRQYADDIWVIANGVSYTAESRDPARVLQLVERHPELAIVQDADRIDSLGVIGISRGFAYGGASEDRKMFSFNIGANLITERFWNYIPRMKTKTGKKEALERWAEMEYFLKRFKEEAEVSHVLLPPGTALDQDNSTYNPEASHQGAD